MKRSPVLDDLLLNHVRRSFPAIDERRARIVVRAFLLVMRQALCNDKVLALPGSIWGPRDLLEELDRWAAQHESAGDDIWEHDGMELGRLIATDVRDHDDWLLTLDDVWRLIARRARDAEPGLTDEELVDVMFSICDSLVDVDESCVRPGCEEPEAAIEDWVIENLDAVGAFLGLPLGHPDLPRRGRQHRFDGGMRADIVCQVVEPSRGLDRGTWVVIELKAGWAIDADLDQLDGYLQRVERELNGPAIGVLLVLGFDEELRRSIDRRDLPIVPVTLTSIGYHDARYEQLLQLERLGRAM